MRWRASRFRPILERKRSWELEPSLVLSGRVAELGGEGRRKAPQHLDVALTEAWLRLAGEAAQNVEPAQRRRERHADPRAHAQRPGERQIAYALVGCHIGDDVRDDALEHSLTERLLERQRAADQWSDAWPLTRGVARNFPR